MVSFKRQYPHFLFPGSNQKEHSLPKSLYDRVVYSIDTLNPITWISTLRFILKEKPDLCVFKYWHFYFTPTYLFLLFFLKMTKIKLTSVVDNLFAHQENFLYNFLNLLSIKIFFYFINFSVTQSDYVSSQFKKFFPNKLEIMLAHPIYDIF
ncbi:hypothetical protein H6768_04240 [Candidatus Peribacteria bacterium]|nr:hypothetical protein [Candidatus Peribacteria bacterium]